MPNYKLGYWVRVWVEAPDLEAACKTNITVDARLGADRVAADIEVEFEHVSQFDEEGREIGRWNESGEIEPHSSDPEFGNMYT